MMFRNNRNVFATWETFLVFLTTSSDCYKMTVILSKYDNVNQSLLLNYRRALCNVRSYIDYYGCFYSQGFFEGFENNKPDYIKVH